MQPATTTSLAEVTFERLGLQRTVKYISGLLKGVAYLHSQGISHRDLTPRNIGINIEKPHAVILDLGMATKCGSNTNHRIGTIAYRAPEVIALKRQETRTPYGAKVDCWSLGLVLAEYLTGERNNWGGVSDGGVTWELYRELHNKLGALTMRKEDRGLTKVYDVICALLEWDLGKRSDCEDLVAFRGGCPIHGSIEPIYPYKNTVLLIRPYKSLLDLPLVMCEGLESFLSKHHRALVNSV